MSADKSGREFDEVPFGGGGLDDVVGVDAHGVENLGELVHEGDVDVALGVLDDFRCLGDFDRGGFVCSVDEDGVVDTVDDVGNLGGGAGGYFLDFLDGMELVAGIDALGGVAGEEVLVELQAADTLYDGKTFFLGNAGIDGGFVDNDVAFGDDFADCLACSPEGFEVGSVVVIDGCGDGDNVEVAVADFVKIGGAAEAVIFQGVLKELVADLECRVMAGVEGVDATLIHVKSNGGIFCRKKTCQRQAYITESDYADFDLLIHCLYDFFKLLLITQLNIFLPKCHF